MTKVDSQTTKGLTIAMVNTAISQGGAAKAAHRLCTAFNHHEEVAQATLIHAQHGQADEQSVGYRVPGARQANAVLARLAGTQAVQDFGFSRYVHKHFSHYDVLHVHNLHGYYLNVENLLARWSDKPVLWTWHDMWGATGRCGFSFDCTGWQRGCQPCPHKSYYPSAWIDRAAAEFEFKFALFASLKNLHIACPSHWLADIAVHRGFDAEHVHVIPYPLDTSRFKSGDKEQLRYKYNVPAGKCVALFVAADCGDPRKGYTHFAHATRDTDCLALAVGINPPQMHGHIRHLGEITDEAVLPELYQVADVMLIPSLADNFPNTVLESIACGTPVLGYAVGGVGEMLTAPGCESVAAGDADALKAALSRFMQIDSQSLSEINISLRQHAQTHWCPTTVADQYLSLLR